MSTDPGTAYAVTQLIRMAELDLSQEETAGLIGRLARVPGVPAALDAALTEIESARAKRDGAT